jgi:hypothetical protein
LLRLFRMVEGHITAGAEVSRLRFRGTVHNLKTLTMEVCPSLQSSSEFQPGSNLTCRAERLNADGWGPQSRRGLLQMHSLA